MHFDLIDLYAVAREVVKSLHPTPVYTVSRLKKVMSRKVQDEKAPSQNAANETIRRMQHRAIHEELSMYYVLPEDCREFSSSDIMERGEHDRSNSSVIPPLTCILLVLRDIESLQEPPVT